MDPLTGGAAHAGARAGPPAGRRPGRGLCGVGLVAVLAACAPPPGAAGSASNAPACEATPGQQVLDRVNAIRRSHGLAALRPHPELIAAARAHSDDLATRGELSHIGSDGRVASERIERAGYDWTMTGENLGAGYDTPARVVAGWMDSPPHRAILLAPQPEHAGVGLTIGPGPGPEWFWTLDVARPSPSETTPALRCHP